MGQDVVSVAKMLTALYEKDIGIITEAFLDTDFLERLMGLFFERHSNNHIHNYFRDAMISVFRRLSGDIFQYVYL